MENKENAISRKRRFSLYWIVPIIATIVTISLIWSNTFNKGELIKLYTDEASGIESGKTLVKFRSVTVGTVENISLSEDFKKTVIYARIKPDFTELLNSDSVFWIVKPRINSTNISGLDTILSGSYITLHKGSSEELSKEFTCLDETPYGFDEQGIIIRLENASERIINPGTAINYDGFKIGVIVNSDYDMDKKHTVYTAKILKKFASLVSDQSVFWVDSGLDMNLGANGLQFSVPSIDNFISGSIDVKQFNSKKGNPLKDNAEYTLYKNQRAAKFANLIDSDSKYVLMLDDSSPLAEGSQVMFRGVKIGEVVKLPWFDNKADLFDLNNKIPALLIMDESGAYDRTQQLFNSLLSKNRLCARLDSMSILSSSSVVNLMIGPKIKCRSSIKKFRDLSVIPIIASTDFKESINNFSKKLNEVEIDKLSANLNKTVEDFDETLKSVRKITESINRNDSVSHLTNTLSSYDSHSELYKSLINMADKLNKTLDELNPTVKKVGQKSNSLVFSSDSKDIEPSVSGK
ncbi:paraquat-inducible protein B [Succinivibrio dextrinosolvens DSM 3072]|uniref:Paraquat-inducible protein B n=1 Tax=Succinivibrio dextrinosolvens DSM 3072 TaxID=1123324 RepID=A0A1T4V3W0_9GAMM|nr:MlaD family protein [Succinivibrio dextrinosolvens]SKA59221.1 paraquat-inducible protein B [Succinivibrio dextrinosolvens DSM 3072]